MKNLLYLTLFIFLLSCGAHLPVDLHPNQAEYGYHALEFDISTKNGIVKKELGIANLFINSEEDFLNTDITIYGIYKGTLNFFSSACGVDLKINFEGIKKLKLSDLIQEPKKCSIKITSITDKIGKKENLIIETGVLKINTSNIQNKPLEIYYTRNDSSSGLKKYSFLGQGSLQRMEGPLSSFEDVTINSNLKDGGIYRVNGCGNELVGEFKLSEFDLNLKNFFKKDILIREDSCDLEIIVIPNSEEFSYQARFTISVYGNEVVKLENLNWKIDRGSLIVTGERYVGICSINEFYSFKKSERKNIECKQKYYPEKIYWIRGITANGRKSVFALKNNKLIWFY